MTINIDHNFVRQFGDTMNLSVQQLGSKLRQAVREERVRGKDFSYEKLLDPNNEMSVITSRHADTVISDLTHSRRVGFLKQYFRAVMIDDEDKVKMLIDPTSDYVRELAGEMNRTVDLRIIEALLGQAASGETGGTLVDLPSAQYIAHGSAGLTLAKAKQALKILMAGDVDIDREDLFIATNAAGYEDLLLDSGLISRDFTQAMPNESGKVPSKIAGFQIIHCQRLSDYTGTTAAAGPAASTNRPAIAFARDALRLGVSMDMMVSVDREPLKQLNHIVTLKTGFGAVRVHDEKVVDIRMQD